MEEQCIYLYEEWEGNWRMAKNRGNRHNHLFSPTLQAGKLEDCAGLDVM